MVSGTTQVVAVIGHPIAQVKSPDNFNRTAHGQRHDPGGYRPGRGGRLP